MNSLGVVNPMGVPAPLARIVRGVPRAAWIFFLAAIAYLLAEARTLPSPDVPSAAWQLVVIGANTGLVIALPGIALVRTPSIRSVAPLAYAGLVLVAVGTVVHAFGGGVVGRVVGVTFDDAATGDPVQSVLLATAWIVVAIGWLALARTLAMRAMSVGIGVTAIAVAAVAAISLPIVPALTSTFGSIAGGGYDVAFGVLVAVGFVAFAVTSVSWAALAWTFIRSMSSDRSGATVAASLWAVAIAIGAGLALAPDRIVSLTWLQANTDLWNSVGTVITMLPPILLASAVALGLLDRAGSPRP